MSNDVLSLRLQDAWRECERNVYHLCCALTSLGSILPMTGERLEYLTDAQAQALDQFIPRFTKLQDAMDSRLFPAILQYLQEQYEERPLLDKLNRLEKLGYIQSAEAWQNLLAGIEKKLKIYQPFLELGKALTVAYPKLLSHCK